MIVTPITVDELTDAERETFKIAQEVDELTPADYTLSRGDDGHAYADNRMSMLADLTTRESVDVDHAAEVAPGSAREAFGGGA